MTLSEYLRFTARGISHRATRPTVTRIGSAVTVQSDPSRYVPVRSHYR